MPKGGSHMPIISKFYGIIIRMYNNGEHNPPHFHAEYQGYNACFDLEGEILNGQMPKTQSRLISAWVELHRKELIANWSLAINEKPLYRISPLK